MSLFHGRPLVGAAYPVFAGLTQERIKELLICVLWIELYGWCMLKGVLI